MEKPRPYAHLASRLNDSTRDFIARELRRRGIGNIEPCHGDIFAVLFGGRRLKIVEIAAATGRTKSTVSVLVERLASRGYVEKRPSEADARALEVVLTERGEALRCVFADISRDMNSRILAGFTPGEAGDLERLLRRAVDNFQ